MAREEFVLEEVLDERNLDPSRLGEVVVGIAVGSPVEQDSQAESKDADQDTEDAVEGGELEDELDKEPEENQEIVVTVDGVKHYLNGIGKVTLLTQQQETDLAKRIEAGLYAAHLLESGAGHQGRLPEYMADLRWVARYGERAKRHLIEANLRLVVFVAKGYTSRGMPFMDIVQEGNLGLIRAVEKFDYTKGFKFSTYATWWIRQAITRGLADQARTIRIPVHTVETINKMGRISRELLTKLGREPTPEELGRELGVSTEKVVELQDWARDPLSLDQPVGDEGDKPLGNYIGDEDTDGSAIDDVVIRSQQSDAIREMLAQLPARERSIIIMRFGLDGSEPLSQRNVAKALRVSGAHIGQVERKVLMKLRHPRYSDALQKLLADS